MWHTYIARLFSWFSYPIHTGLVDDMLYREMVYVRIEKSGIARKEKHIS